MRIGPWEVHEGAAIVVGFGALIAVALLITWAKNRRTADELKDYARAQNWEWAGKAPPDLKATLGDLQDSSNPWHGKTVMVVAGEAGREFLFRYNKQISGSSSSAGHSTSITSDGMACLVPGSVAANTAVYTIERRPLKLLDAYLEMAGNPVSDAGSPAFRERFLIQSIGAAWHGNEDGADIAAVEISPTFEAEMSRWHRPLGQDQVWSKVHVRDGQVLITKNWRANFPPEDWLALLEMCRGLSRALRAPG